MILIQLFINHENRSHKNYSYNQNIQQHEYSECL